ncbi:MAG: arylesterase [Pseudomonadota bacterium]
MKQLPGTQKRASRGRSRTSLSRRLMHGLGALLVICCAATGHAGTPDSPATSDRFVSADQPGLRVLVFGDSISAAYGIDRADGWATLLDARLRALDPSFGAINASISGETTQGGAARIAHALALHKPDVVFVELGGNDALRGYPISDTRANLTQMLRLSREAGASPILLGMDIPPNYGPRYRRDFRGAFVSAAEATGAFLVPFFLDGVALVDGMMQSDGIHPTAAAQARLLATGWAALTETAGERFPALLDWDPDP